MKILKVLVGLDDGTIVKVDAIEYEGGLWLVPQWLDVPAQRVTKPARLIRMDVLQHQRMPPTYKADFVLNAGMPKALFDCSAPLKSALGYEVRELPEISLPAADKAANLSLGDTPLSPLTVFPIRFCTARADFFPSCFSTASTYFTRSFNLSLTFGSAP
jgi:hypothetical protein